LLCHGHPLEGKIMTAIGLRSQSAPPARAWQPSAKALSAFALFGILPHCVRRWKSLQMLIPIISPATSRRHSSRTLQRRGRASASIIAQTKDAWSD